MLRKRGGHSEIPAGGGTAGGEQGEGRLAPLSDILLAALRALSPQDMAGRRVMVTLGPTREAWDGVRFWSNPSSGLMGAALAVAAWLRGAEVTVICGPGVRARLPREIVRHAVVSARDMFQAAADIWPGMDMGMFGGTGETLVLNANHPLVQYVLGHKEDANTSKICEQLYDLASLSHGPLAPERMTAFVSRINESIMIMAGEKTETEKAE